MRVGVLVAVSAVVLAASAAAGEDVPPKRFGPAFGTNRVATTIDPVGGAPDVDDYVAVLAKGERLFVAVAADAKSSLFPTITLVDPSGATVDPGAKPRRGGRSRVVAGHVVGSTGPWTVRVGAADGAAAGDYVAAFKIAPPRPSRPVRGVVGGEAASMATHAFDAVDGSVASFTVRSARRAVTARSLVDPAGRVVPLPASAEGAVLLAGGDGEYRLTVGADGDAETAYSLALVVKPPARPRGRSAVPGAEPYVAPRAAPMEAVAGGVVRIPGAHFSAAPNPPAVYLGDFRTSVAAVGPYGAWLDVGAPAGAVGDVFDLVVQNADGQAVARPAYVRLAAPKVLDVLSIEPSAVVLQLGATQDFAVTLTEPAPPLGTVVSIETTGAVGSSPATLGFPGGATIARFRVAASVVPSKGRIAATLRSSVGADVIVSEPAELASIEPASVRVLEGAVAVFTVTLDAPAPPIGLDVAVAATGGVGTVPASLHFDAGVSSATFELRATDVRAAGKVVVSSTDSVEAEVVVEPPSTIDLSGWTIVQQDPARTFGLPSGTVLSEGGYVVVGRRATRGEFETFWGRTLGADVIYLNAADQFLVINGSETFELRDASGATVDGPSAAMPAAAGAVLRRRPGTPAAPPGSWTTASASPVSNATPGAGQTAAATPAGAYVSQFSDAVGTGNWVFEFVEIYFDRFP
jgi:hypothetical protein